MLASEEILARYKKTVSKIDSLDRTITVGKLKPSQQVQVMTLADTDLRAPLNIMQIAAAVRKIDDVPYPFPKSKAELMAVVDVLDDEGLAAALEATIEINGGTVAADGTVVAAAEIAEAVKNG